MNPERTRSERTRERLRRGGRPRWSEVSWMPLVAVVVPVWVAALLVIGPRIGWFTTLVDAVLVWVAAVAVLRAIVLIRRAWVRAHRNGRRSGRSSVPDPRGRPGRTMLQVQRSVGIIYAAVLAAGLIVGLARHDLWWGVGVSVAGILLVMSAALPIGLVVSIWEQRRGRRAPR